LVNLRFPGYMMFISLDIKKAGATSVVGTANPSGAHELNP